MTDQVFQSERALAQRVPFSAPAAAVTAPILLIVFMVVLIMPVSFDIAGFRLSPIRLYLLIMFIPLLTQLLGGKVGKMHFIDAAMLLFAAWLMITLLYHEGMAKFAYSAISVAELLGGYLVGRTLIRNANDFRFLIKCQIGIMLFLFPLAVIESITNNQLWSKFLDIFGEAKFRGGSSRPRYGYQRVSTGFDHPILYGVFCSVAAANVVYIWRDNLTRAIGWLGFVTVMAFLSLSSGALLSVVFQICLTVWDILTRSKWRLLVTLSVCTYIFLTFASNRGPLILMIETMTFSPGTGWTRVIQWEYGSAEVLRNPIWGKGLDGDWIRPSWLYTSSIDNYWLVVAFRHGLPGIFFLGLAFIGGFTKIVRAKNLDPGSSQIRTGYLIAFAGICFSLGTVHIWNALAVYIYCYLGAGLWLATQSAQAGADMPPPPPRRLSRYGRAIEPATDIIPPQDDPDEMAQTPYSRFPIRPTKRNNT
jgi:hypothetical protein